SQFSTPLNQLCPFICMIIFRHMFFLPFPFYTKIKSASRNEKADCSIVLCFYFFSNFNCTFCLVFNRCFYFFGQSTLYCCCRGTIRVTSLSKYSFIRIPRRYDDSSPLHHDCI